MSAAVAYPLTVYYDASCPLCASEMQALKAADRDNKLLLVDCSRPDFDDRPFAADGVTRDAMARLIHARDTNGRWLVGPEVFEAAYDAAGFPTIARLWGNSRLRPLWNRLYPWVARHRRLLSRLGAQHAFRTLARHAARRSAATAACDAETACPPSTRSGTNARS
jgi:predicted DCC family thiol-disulfide oxidoreductase YuxK